MMDLEFFKWLIEQSGVVALALLALFFLRRSHFEIDELRKMQIEQVRKTAELECARTDQLIRAIKEFSCAMKELSEAVHALREVVSASSNEERESRRSTERR